MEENVEVGYTCGGKRNEQVEVNSDPGFWEFHQKGVGGGPCAPCRNPVGTKRKRSRWCKTRQEGVENREPADPSVM